MKLSLIGDIALILLVIILALQYWKLCRKGASQKGRLCRGCDRRKEEMAITYGEDEGLCRECLDEYLPLALKE